MSFSRTIKVGTWHERAAREVTRCPSYYAADTETLRTVPGDYPVRIAFVGGYMVPMPYWLLVGIDAERVDGRLYSGFGGVNFASTELPKGEAVRYTIQGYDYELGKMVEDGHITLEPGFEWMLGGAYERSWKHPDAPKDWNDPRFEQEDRK